MCAVKGGWCERTYGDKTLLREGNVHPDNGKEGARREDFPKGVGHAVDAVDTVLGEVLLALGFEAANGGSLAGCLVGGGDVGDEVLELGAEGGGVGDVEEEEDLGLLGETGAVRGLAIVSGNFHQVREVKVIVLHAAMRGTHKISPCTLESLKSWSAMLAGYHTNCSSRLCWCDYV